VCAFYWMAARLGIAITLSACAFFPFAALALYCALLCTLLLIAEQSLVSAAIPAFVNIVP
jgi:hypothetical protein